MIRQLARTARQISTSAPLRGVQDSSAFIRESPVVHKKTWIEALRTRNELLEEHPEMAKKGIVFAHNDVKTREVSSRTTSDSFTAVVFPFKDNKWFLDGYINAFGRFRMGQLFMDLDRLSGIVANKHCEPAEPVIVTASVDRILLLKRLDDLSDHNVVLWGYVSWTGRSSMEITIHASSTTSSFSESEPITLESCRELDTWLVANFTFVARDPETQRAFAVNHLKPTTRGELTEFVMAEKYNERKKKVAKRDALTISPPSSEESKDVHDLWLRRRFSVDGKDANGKKIVSMDDTKVYSTGIMQPQYRNRHSFMIFGGYMMRQTFELAYACAGAFSHLPPRFVSLDTVSFRNPVPVGSVLNLTAFVAYTQPSKREIKMVDGDTKVQNGTLTQIRVQSVVRGLDNEDHKDAGTFIYSFFTEGESSYEMIPESYEEMMIYLEGRRQAGQSREYLHDLVEAH